MPGIEAADEIRPLRRVEYERLVEHGCFEDERVELLRGMVVRMSPHGPAHDSTIQRLNRVLGQLLRDRADIRIQCAFAASDGSEPEPDVAVVDVADYDAGHPSEAWLIVEVAESSLAKDRGTKAAIYAESDVPEYWVVNLVERVIEVSTRPEGGRYTMLRTFRRGETFHCDALDADIAVDAIVR